MRRPVAYVNESRRSTAHRVPGRWRKTSPRKALSGPLSPLSPPPTDTLANLGPREVRDRFTRRAASPYGPSTNAYGDAARRRQRPRSGPALLQRLDLVGVARGVLAPQLLDDAGRRQRRVLREDADG